MTMSNASFRSWNSASRRVPDWLVRRSGVVQRRREKPRFDWLENRRLLAPVVAVYPFQYDGGVTQGVAASSSAIWVTEQSGSLASINPANGNSTQYNIPTPNSGPTAIAAGPDGNSMWFLETTANRIGEINLTTDAFSEFPLLDTPKAGLLGITAGPADEVWFTEFNANKIGMIDTQTGAISEFPLPGVNTKPVGITYGPDGNLWIAEAGANQIASFDPTTDVAQVHSIGGTSNHEVEGITVGPDQNIWFTETAANAIGMFNLTTQTFAKAIPLGSGAYPTGITSGPDGNIWVTESQIQYEVSYGTVAVYNLATGKVTPFVNQYLNGLRLGAITPGPGTSKDLWASGGQSGQVLEVTTSGAMNATTLTTTDGSETPTSIVSDLNGNLWFTQPDDYQVGVFDPQTDLSTEFSLASDAWGPEPQAIALDPLTGSLWFVASTYDDAVLVIGEVNPVTDAITTFDAFLDFLTPDATAITFDPEDGYFWFTDQGDSRIGFVNPTTGAITDNIALPDQSFPNSIVADDNGNLWFTEPIVNALGEYDPKTSKLKNYPIATDATSVITVDAKGNLWITGADNAELAEINPATGTVTTTVNANVSDGSIALGPDDNLWFASGQGIGTYNLTSGESTSYSVPGGYAEAVTAGEDGNVWFTGEGSPAFIGGVGLTAATQASNLSIATQPGNTTVGAGFGLVVAVDNPSGSLDRFYQGTVSVSLATDPSGDATLGGTLTATVVNGEAVFAGLTLNNAGTGYVIQATATGITSATTQPFNVATAATQLVVTTEPPVSVAVGTEFTTIVSAEDGNGNLDASYELPITLTLLNNTEGATLGGTVTQGADNGVATFTDLTVNQPGDGYALQAASGTLATAQSSEFDVTVPPATHLVIATAPPSTLVAGTPFGLIVDAENDQGNIDPSYDGAVTLTLSGGASQAMLGGTLQVDATAGVATFSGLTIDLAGSGYTINVAGGSLTGTAAGPITVTPAAATQLVLTQEPSTLATAGVPFPLQPIIEEEDPFGNLETGDNSTVVTASLSNGVGPLQGTTSITVQGGVATFIDLADDTAETITLEFTGGGLSAGPSTPIVVGPANLGALVIQTQPSSTAQAGTAFAQQPVIVEEDQYGNRETGDNSTVVTVSMTDGLGLPDGTTSVTVQNGVAVFTDLFVTIAGTIALDFSGDGLISQPSNSIVVSPAAPFRLKIQTQPSPTATAGQSFATQPVIDELDQYGNLETTDSSTVITTALSFGNGPLLGTTTATLTGGVATFTNLADSTIGTISLGFSGGSLSVGPSHPITIGPGPAAQLVIATQPYAMVTAGNLLTDPIVVDEEDQYGNIVTTDNVTVVTASLATGAGTLKGTTSVTLVDGVASFDDLEDDKAGTLSLRFAAPSLPPVTSSSSVVAPGPAKTLVIQPPGDIISGEPFAVEADIDDAYGNLVTSFNGSVTLGLASGSTGSLSGNRSTTATQGVAEFTDLVDTTSGSISLSATSGTLTSRSSGDVPVSPSVPTHLVIQTQPSATATVGQAFATQPVIAVEDQFGNLVTNDNSTEVTVSLGAGTGPLLGTTTVVVSGGVARFTNLADSTAEPITLEFRSGGLISATSGSIVVTPSPTPTPPTIIGERVVLTYLHYNPKGKPKGKPVVSIVFDFSTAMNAGTADNPNNYQVDWFTTKKGKRIPHPISILSATPGASATTVTLSTSATQKTFAKGGRITVVYSPPDGVSNAAGVPLAAGDSTFTISSRATSIAQG